jgi:hypothetical protein
MDVGFVKATNRWRRKGQPASELGESALEDAPFRLRLSVAFLCGCMQATSARTVLPLRPFDVQVMGCHRRVRSIGGSTMTMTMITRRPSWRTAGESTSTCSGTSRRAASRSASLTRERDDSFELEIDGRHALDAVNHHLRVRARTTWMRRSVAGRSSLRQRAGRALPPDDAPRP